MLSPRHSRHVVLAALKSRQDTAPGRQKKSTDSKLGTQSVKCCAVLQSQCQLAPEFLRVFPSIS